MPEQVYAFVGRCEHGKVRAISVDLPGDKRLVDRDTIEFARAGLTVQRVTIEEARKVDMRCDPFRAKRKLERAKQIKRNAF